jgi:hypothetical protein
MGENIKEKQSGLLHYESDLCMASIRIINTQHTELETHGGSHGEAKADPSILWEMVLYWTPHECRDTKLLAHCLWVHHNVPTLKGRANKRGAGGGGGRGFEKSSWTFLPSF